MHEEPRPLEIQESTPEDKTVREMPGTRLREDGQFTEIDDPDISIRQGRFWMESITLHVGVADLPLASVVLL